MDEENRTKESFKYAKAGGALSNPFLSPPSPRQPRKNSTQSYLFPTVDYIRVTISPRLICFVLALSGFALFASAEDFPDAIHAYLQQRVHAEIPNGCIVVGIVDEHGIRIISFGTLDDGTDREADGDTVFGLHSMT